VKDSGPSGCLRRVPATATNLAQPGQPGAATAGTGAAQPRPAGGEDNAAPSRGPEDGRDGADSRALEIAAAGVSGKAKTAALAEQRPASGEPVRPTIRRTPQRRNRLTR